MEDKTEDNFLVYVNPFTKTTSLEKLQGKFCRLILTNGFFYEGYVSMFNDDILVFLDRTYGETKFPMSRVFTCYEKPKRIKDKLKEVKKDGRV